MVRGKGITDRPTSFRTSRFKGKSWLVFLSGGAVLLLVQAAEAQPAPGTPLFITPMTNVVSIDGLRAMPDGRLFVWDSFPSDHLGVWINTDGTLDASFRAG